MKGFALDSTGDVVISNEEIVMVYGDKLLQQKVKTVLDTNLGEWFFNREEGIDYHKILGKGINEELVRYEIERGLAQVDESFTITEFECVLDLKGRKVTVTFSASTKEGEQVGGEYTWA